MILVHKMGISNKITNVQLTLCLRYYVVTNKPFKVTFSQLKKN